MSSQRAEEPVRQHSVDYLPGTSGNPIAPFQRDYQPRQGPIRRDWVYLLSIGAVLVAGGFGFLVRGTWRHRPRHRVSRAVSVPCACSQILGR